MAARQKQVLVLRGEQARRLWNLVSNSEWSIEYEYKTVEGKKVLEVSVE